MCSRHELSERTSGSHLEHLKHDIGRQSSLNSICNTRNSASATKKCNYGTTHDTRESVGSNGVSFEAFVDSLIFCLASKPVESKGLSDTPGH